MRYRHKPTGVLCEFVRITAHGWLCVRENHVPYCCLYDEGLERIGCVMCPFIHERHRERDAARWPNIYRAYLWAFDKMIEARKAAGKRCGWQTAQEVMDWWIAKAARVPDEQMEMFA